jgi:F-type H+-transporting ATPase subunit delta
VIRRFARPYARAILDVAGSTTTAAGLLAELRRFESARSGSAELHEVFANPGIDVAAKHGIARQIAERLQLSPLAAKVLGVLIDNHRINDLGPILDGLRAMVNEAEGVVVAEVRSAHALQPDEVRQLQQTLEKKLGKKVEVQLTTDPTLMGGFVARIGSEILNASVAGKIEKFKHSLS